MDKTSNPRYIAILPCCRDATPTLPAPGHIRGQATSESHPSPDSSTPSFYFTMTPFSYPPFSAYTHPGDRRVHPYAGPASWGKWGHSASIDTDLATQLLTQHHHLTRTPSARLDILHIRCPSSPTSRTRLANHLPNNMRLRRCNINHQPLRPPPRVRRPVRHHLASPSVQTRRWRPASRPLRPGTERGRRARQKV